MRNFANWLRWKKLSVVGVLAVSGLAPGAATFAQDHETDMEKPAAAITRSELEIALSELVEPVTRRVVVRNDENLYDVWLISQLDFEKASEVFRQAISAKRVLPGGLRVDHWTWIDTERAYVLDVTGGSKPYRVRLTRHLGGAMLELENVGAAKDAPRWAPPYRPRPVLLPHGQNR